MRTIAGAHRRTRMTSRVRAANLHDAKVHGGRGKGRERECEREIERE